MASHFKRFQSEATSFLRLTLIIYGDQLGLTIDKNGDKYYSFTTETVFPAGAVAGAIRREIDHHTSMSGYQGENRVLDRVTRVYLEKYRDAATGSGQMITEVNRVVDEIQKTYLNALKTKHTTVARQTISSTIPGKRSLKIDSRVPLIPSSSW